jgi:hypothetical protein
MRFLLTCAVLAVLGCGIDQGTPETQQDATSEGQQSEITCDPDNGCTGGGGGGACTGCSTNVDPCGARACTSNGCVCVPVTTTTGPACCFGG